MRRIPSLDGLRALAISAVILGHLSGTRGFPPALGPLLYNDYLDLAHTGVVAFFVISGFLITGLLLAEQQLVGRIDLPRFYLRRTTRIAIPYFVFLAVIAAMTATGVIAVPTKQFVFAVTYTMNYAGGHIGPDPGGQAWYLGHLWSLAVEEQFYLLWPAVLVLAGVRRATWAAVAAVCVVPLIRVLFFMHDQSNLSKVGITFETTADVLAMGCLLALFRASDQALELPSWLAPLLIVAGIACNVRWRLGLLVGRSLLALGIAVGIDRCVRHPTSWFGRILNARPLVFVGEISYSLYLWQQVALNRNSPTSRFPLNLALAGLLALISYYAIEQPARTRIRPAAERWLAQWRERRWDPGEVVPLG